MLDASLISDDPATNLQLGLTIELSVLPPYLYALWSLRTKADGGSDAAVEAARTIRGVVYEEMLHAALVGNLLRSLGTPPVVAKPPMPYPGPLPGHVASGPGSYQVSLEPLSKDAVATFKKIELPTWDDPDKPPPGTWATIGDLYLKIAKELKARNPTFSAKGQLPLGDNPGPGKLVQVKDLATALEAIETIIEQGEGHQQPTKQHPSAEDDDDHEVAHFDQFVAIWRYLDAGTIDPAKHVWPLVKDPRASKYSTAQQAANQAFNGAYSRLLDSLHDMFNAASPRAYGTPTDLMNELEHLAALLRATGPIPGIQPNALPGPTFEYVPASRRGAS